MWTTTLDEDHRSASMLDASIEVIVEPSAGGGAQLAMIRVTIPPGAVMPTHDHGASEALLIPEEGSLVFYDADQQPRRLKPGSVAVIAPHERVRAENPTDEAARLLICFSPPSFVEALPAGAARTAVG